MLVSKSGLGLKEYLDFIEDVGMQPIMAVWSGMLQFSNAGGVTRAYSIEIKAMRLAERLYQKTI